MVDISRSKPMRSLLMRLMKSSNIRHSVSTRRPIMITMTACGGYEVLKH